MKPVDGLKVATVTAVADPLALGRVLIRFTDAVAETQVWARVAGSPQGGRGAVAQFEVSDEVLVAFAGGDPRNPIVLGGLWQGDAPAPTDSSAGATHRTVRPIPRAGK